jgi:hypothetical protein
MATAARAANSKTNFAVLMANPPLKVCESRHHNLASPAAHRKNAPSAAPSLPRLGNGIDGG